MLLPRGYSVSRARKDGFVRYINGVLLDGNDNEITVTDVVADWAELQAIPKVAGNNNIVLHVDGLGVCGSDWRYKHAYGRWFAVGDPYLKDSYTAVTHGATLTTEEVGFQFQLPNDYGGQNKSILQDGDRLIIQALLTKVNAGAGVDGINPNFKFHTASGTDGTSVASFTPAAANRHVGLEFTFQRTSSTTLRLTGQIHNSVAGPNVASSTTYQGDVVVPNMDTSPEFWQKLTFKCTSTGTDSSLKVENHSIRIKSSRQG